MKGFGLILAGAAIATLVGGAVADPDPVEAGRAFLAENCAGCHAIDAEGESPLEAAPPFRDLHRLYPVEYLEEALAEGIVTGHPDMPQAVLEPEMIAAVIAYLHTLE